MGPAGDLMIRTESDDQPTVQRLKLLFAEPDRRRGREDARGGTERMMPYGRSPYGGRRQ
jgi:hypothetical protein